MSADSQPRPRRWLPAAGYVAATLLPGERVVHWGTLHWALYLKGALVIALGAVVVLFSAWASKSLTDPAHSDTGASGAVVPTAGWVILAAGAAELLRAWVQMTTTELAVTDQRVIVKTGWVRRRTSELRLAKVETIRVDQSFFGRLLDYGTVIIVGTGGTAEPVAFISDPIAFRKAVQAASH
jgi:uncharacterized membrane protein YdbT with pleckstrin-like domain